MRKFWKEVVRRALFVACIGMRAVNSILRRGNTMFRNIDSLQREKVELYDYMLVSWHLRLFMYLPTGFTASVSVDCFGNYGSLWDFCLKSLYLLFFVRRFVKRSKSNFYLLLCCRCIITMHGNILWLLNCNCADSYHIITWDRLSHQNSCKSCVAYY